MSKARAPQPAKGMADAKDSKAPSISPDITLWIPSTVPNKTLTYGRNLWNPFLATASAISVFTFGGNLGNTVLIIGFIKDHFNLSPNPPIA